MFNDKYQLTKLVLDGKKTQTRRLIPQRFFDLNSPIISRYNKNTNDIRIEFRSDRGNYSVDIIDSTWNRYYVGDIIAIAQPYKDIINNPIIKGCSYEQLQNMIEHSAGWKNKMFVKAELMPYQIRITNVKVEKLQDISDEDCLKEGVIKIMDNHYCIKYRTNKGLIKAPNYYSPKLAYKDLINKISGKDTWDNNPFVFVYDFELVK